jgi:hypothetical protein
MSQAQVNLESARAFPMYGTRAKYKQATGVDAPPFDSTRKIKRWMDLTAGADGFPEVVYQNTLMLNASGEFISRNGVPIVRPLVLTVEDAKTVNLPAEDVNGYTAIQPENLPEIQCPFRALTADETLVVAGPEAGLLSGRAIFIRNTKLWAEEQAQAAEEEGLFTAQDRALLKSIAKKLGLEA